MAAKVIPSERHHFMFYSPKEAKLNWRKHKLQDPTGEAWDNRKANVMFWCLEQKFSDTPYNKHLRHKLIATGDKYLEETNWWRDTYWGVDCNTGEGQNNLGAMLMRIRNKIQN
jgi:predicted NAD-dependent protein-ADP-ribosyltransferase YbiA (DUF1768 family)